MVLHEVPECTCAPHPLLQSVTFAESPDAIPAPITVVELVYKMAVPSTPDEPISVVVTGQTSEVWLTSKPPGPSQEPSKLWRARKEPSTSPLSVSIMKLIAISPALVVVYLLGYHTDGSVARNALVLSCKCIPHDKSEAEQSLSDRFASMPLTEPTAKMVYMPSDDGSETKTVTSPEALAWIPPLPAMVAV